MVAAAKATHLGSTLLDSNISKENVERYAIEMSVKITEAYEAKLEQGLIRPSNVAVSIVVTDSSIGALKGHYKKGLPDPDEHVSTCNALPCHALPCYAINARARVAFLSLPRCARAQLFVGELLLTTAPRQCVNALSSAERVRVRLTCYGCGLVADAVRQVRARW